jgi:hypothetical protein
MFTISTSHTKYAGVSCVVCCSSARKRYEMGMIMRLVMCRFFIKCTSLYILGVLSHYSSLDSPDIKYRFLWDVNNRVGVQ